MLLGTFWDKSCREDSSTEHLLMDPHRQVIYASDICVWFITESFWEFNWITVFQLFNFESWNLHTLLHYQLIPNPFSALNRSWHRVVLQKLLSFFSAPPSAVWLDFLFCLKARRGPSPTFQMVWFCYLLSGWHLASLSGCFLTEFYFPNASWYRFLSNFPLDPAIFLAGKGCDCIWLVVNTPAHICLELRFLDLWAAVPCGALREHAAPNTLFWTKKIPRHILGNGQNLLELIHSLEKVRPCHYLSLLFI